MLGWRKGAGLGLLLLVVGGLAAPTAAVLASDPCCSGMKAASDRHDEAPARCQWITPTSCCDENAALGAAVVFAPLPAAACFQAATPPIPQHHRPLVLAAPLTSQALAALSTIVLRL